MNKQREENAEKKALMVATVAPMIQGFNMDNIAILQELGYSVHVAANFRTADAGGRARNKAFQEILDTQAVRYFDLPFSRSPLAGSNLYAYKRLKSIIQEENYSLVHCHSPVGGMLTRLACRKARRLGTKVLYTAHGFHFFKGAPLRNWLLYYPVEKWLSRYTDMLITINREDFARAQKFKAGKVEYVPGVGVDTDKFVPDPEMRKAKRRELQLPEDAIVLLSVGELNKNKNHETVIQALVGLQNQNLYYMIAGAGPLQAYLQEQINTLGLKERVRLLGFRDDIAALCSAADIFVFPSFREGLPVSLMEAMAAGLPIICSQIRGNEDLICAEKGGLFFEPKDSKTLEKEIRRLVEDASLRAKMGEYNRQRIPKFALQTVREEMRRIYTS